MKEAKFKPGERVRVLKAYPPGHIRTPHYIRGCVGEVERLCGGKPQRARLTDQPVAVVKWVDGTLLDTVFRLQD